MDYEAAMRFFVQIDPSLDLKTAHKYAQALVNYVRTYDSNVYVQAALNSVSVMDYMRQGKPINAIKELRSITKSSLKDAKDAIESDAVQAAVFSWLN